MLNITLPTKLQTTVLAIGLVVATALSLHSIGPADAEDPANAQIVRLQELAQRAAVTNGDDTPENAIYVESTHGEALAAVSGAVSSGAQGEAVFVLQQEGNFTARYAHPPFGRSLPTGKFMTLIVSQARGVVLDFGLAQSRVDLSTLGAERRL